MQLPKDSLAAIRRPGNLVVAWNAVHAGGLTLKPRFCSLTLRRFREHFLSGGQNGLEEWLCDFATRICPPCRFCFRCGFPFVRRPSGLPIPGPGEPAFPNAGWAKALSGKPNGNGVAPTGSFRSIRLAAQ